MKLTLVSISSKGKTTSCFARACTVQGKTVVSNKIINEMLKTIDCTKKNQVFTIGNDSGCCFVVK